MYPPYVKCKKEALIQFIHYRYAMRDLSLAGTLTTLCLRLHRRCLGALSLARGDRTLNDTNARGHKTLAILHFVPLPIPSIFVLSSSVNSAGWSEHDNTSFDSRLAAGCGRERTVNCAVPSVFETFQLFRPLSICFPCCCAANGPTLNRATTPPHYHTTISLRRNVRTTERIDRG